MSLKLNNIDEKKRLSRIVREILPKDTGAIVRTEAKWKTQNRTPSRHARTSKKWKR